MLWSTKKPTMEKIVLAQKIQPFSILRRRKGQGLCIFTQPDSCDHAEWHDDEDIDVKILDQAENILQDEPEVPIIPSVCEWLKSTWTKDD